MNRYGSIYLMTNLITNKSYVGQTIQLIEKRISQHCRDNRSGRHLYNTICKYGINNFQITELVTCFDQESLNIMETYFINQFQTFSPTGYNLTMGGNQKGKITEEVRLKMSLAKKGKPSRKKDHSWSDALKLSTSKRQGGKPIIAKNVITGIETRFEFIQQACTIGGFTNSSIYHVMNGNRRTHKNHIFYYENQANQNGSAGSNKPEHVQRIDSETK